MKRKIFSKTLAIVMILALITAFAAIPASAAYDAVNGGTISFTQYLIIDENARIPGITFTYSIAPGAAVDATASTPAIIAGVGEPTVTNAAFSSGESAAYEKASGDTLTLASGEKYAKKSVDINFSGVSFSQPGIYRYVVTELTNSDHKAVSYDTQASTSGSRTRYLDVYVTDNDGTLSVSSYVMHQTTAVEVVGSDDTAVSDKSNCFVNVVTSYEIEFGKEVTGNQGSKEKYFKFTLVLTNVQASNTYDVDLIKAESSPTTNAATVYETMSNPSTIVASEGGAIEADFYLKDGQYITVKGLPSGCRYTLRESSEDYTSSEGIAAANNANSIAHSDPVASPTNQNLSADIKTGFTNNRAGTIPTGVLLTVAPFAIGLLVFGALAFFLISKRRRENY